MISFYHGCSFIQLDLGHLRVGNEFSWHGGPEKDPSAVHLDILDAEVFITLKYVISIRKFEILDFD